MSAQPTSPPVEPEAIEGRLRRLEARISGIENGQAQLHIDLQNMRAEQSSGQVNLRLDFAEVKGMFKAIVEILKKEPI